jgi:hypothetical protein
MKRLQNPRMVDGDDRNDMKDMENMEHWGENENHVWKTWKTILIRKQKKKISKGCW